MKALGSKRVAARHASDTRAAAVQQALIARGHGECNDHGIARALELNDHSYVGDLFDPAKKPAIVVGDLGAYPRAFAEEFLIGELAALTSDRKDPSTRDTFDGVAIVLGEALAALRADLASDGREDEHDKHAAALRRIALIALRGADASQRRSCGCAR